MKYFVYFLLSLTHRRTYSSQTDDVEARLAQHNDGKVRSTKAYRPWVLIHKEDFLTRAEAMRREKWLKTRQGRKFISKLVEEWRGRH